MLFLDKKGVDREGLEAEDGYDCITLPTAYTATRAMVLYFNTVYNGPHVQNLNP
jgi:hypothetical protein